jgi:hypothetical protein
MSDCVGRCAAVTAALQDLARDLEADLGKAARCRGRVDPSSGPLAWLRDPGANLDAFNLQLANFAHTPDRVLSAYSHAALNARTFVHAEGIAGPDLTARAEVFDLIEAIQQVTNHADAAELVATFNN